MDIESLADAAKKSFRNLIKNHGLRFLPWDFQTDKVLEESVPLPIIIGTLPVSKNFPRTILVL